MPLQGDLSDELVRIRDRLDRMQSQIAASNVVELVASANNTETITVAGGADSGFVALTSGPQLDVVTNSGQITVTVSARISIPNANASAIALCSYEIRDAAGVQVIAPDNLRALITYNGPDASSMAQASYQAVHNGLTPGKYTIKALYRFTDGPAGGAGPFSANFINRALIAKGY